MTLNILSISTNNDSKIDKYSFDNRTYIKKKKNYLFNYVNNSFYKKKILDYLYDNLDLSNYKFNLVKDKLSVLYVLKNDKYYIQYNYSGVSSYLVFLRIKDKYFSVFIEKKNLSFNKNKKNLGNIRIREIEVSAKLNIYNGTIMEGFLIYDNKKMEVNFLINDILFLAGNKLVNDKLNDKFSMYESYISSNPIKNKYDSNKKTTIKINKFYELNSIKQLIDNIQDDKSKIFLKKLIKGLSFVKEVSGQKIIFIFNNNNENSSDSENKKVYNEDKSYRNKKQYLGPAEKIKKIEVTGDVTAIFEMRKTQIVDVYELYLLKVKKDKTTNKIKAKKRKHDIAYIPTVECSNFCKFFFNDDDTVLVDCKYLSDKDKWVPFKLIEGKKNPDRLKKVEEKLNNINL